VIKNLGHLFKAIDGISGATILGDGTVALILDVNRLIQQEEVFEINEYRSCSQGPKDKFNKPERLIFEMDGCKREM
jgi:chemotaxis protein histidine kinase CheA